VGIALTMYGREEEADPLIDSLQVTNSQTTMSLVSVSTLYTVYYTNSVYYVLYIMCCILCAVCYTNGVFYMLYMLYCILYTV